MATFYTPDLYPKLAFLLNQTYQDGLDRIVWARLEDDEKTTVGVAIDGPKAILFKIGETTIKYKLIPQAQAQNQAALEAASYSEGDLINLIHADVSDADFEIEEGKDSPPYFEQVDD